MQSNSLSLFVAWDGADSYPADRDDSELSLGIPKAENNLADVGSQQDVTSKTWKINCWSQVTEFLTTCRPPTANPRRSSPTVLMPSLNWKWFVGEDASGCTLNINWSRRRKKIPRPVLWRIPEIDALESDQSRQSLHSPMSCWVIRTLHFYSLMTSFQRTPAPASARDGWNSLVQSVHVHYTSDLHFLDLW